MTRRSRRRSGLQFSYLYSEILAQFIERHADGRREFLAAVASQSVLVAQEMAQPRGELSVQVKQADIAGQVEGEKVGIHILGQPRDPAVQIRDAHLEIQRNGMYVGRYATRRRKRCLAVGAVGAGILVTGGSAASGCTVFVGSA